MKGELHVAGIGRKFEPGKVGAQARENGGLDLLLQFLARGCFDRGDAGIAGASNESATRFGLDPVNVLRYQAIDFHGRIVARKASPATYKAGDLDYRSANGKALTAEHAENAENRRRGAEKRPWGCSAISAKPRRTLR